jgi:hypothetical protein
MRPAYCGLEFSRGGVLVHGHPRDDEAQIALDDMVFIQKIIILAKGH